MAMIKIQCDGCNRVVDYDEDCFSDGLTCRVCGDYFSQVDEEDLEEDESEDEDDYDEEESEDEDYDYKETTTSESTINPLILDTEVSKGIFNPEAKTKFD